RPGGTVGRHVLVLRGAGRGLPSGRARARGCARMKRLRLPTHTGFDLMLLSVVLALLGIGLAMVYSASGIKALDTQDDPRYFLVQQSAWVAIGLAAMFIVARVDYHRYRRLALPGLALAVLLLAVVLVPAVG